VPARARVDWGVFDKMQEIPVGFKKLVPEAKLPTIAHPGDAGMDLYCVGPTFVPVGGAPTLISTGIAVDLHPMYWGLIKSKSGLAAKGLDVGAGVVDVGYSGEIKVVMFNHSGSGYQFKAGDKIAQLILIPYVPTRIYEVEHLKKSQRGASGFGSSGR